MGTCGISHRWSSSREDCSRSSSSNNSDIEDLRQVIVHLFRSRNIPIVIVLTCWTTGRQQPWQCHIWQQLTLRPSLTFLPTNSNTNLQHTGSVPRQFILVAAHKSHAARAYSNSATMRVHYDERISAGSGVTVSPRDGCDMQPLIVRPAHLIQSHRVPTRPP